MTEFARPHDVDIAKALLELGMSPDCKCRPFLDFRLSNPPVVSLEYTIYCTVHYPNTAKLLNLAGEK